MYVKVMMMMMMMMMMVLDFALASLSFKPIAALALQARAEA